MNIIPLTAWTKGDCHDDTSKKTKASIATSFFRKIMMFVFAFGEGNPSKRNYFKAALIWAAIILGIYLVFFVLIFGMFFSAANSSF